MKGDESSGGRARARGRALFWTLSAIPLLAVVVILAGVGLVAFLGQSGNDTTWTRWSSVGEAFGVVNSVVSALAVAALVITWLLQSRDLRTQNIALAHTTEVGLRDQHVTLIRMAVDRPCLAEVWPKHAGIDATVQVQYLYANLLLQHVWMQYTTGHATHAEMVSNLRFLFASPHVRAYWRDTANSRQTIYVDGTREVSLAAVADEIWREYQDVLACSGERTAELREP